MCAFKFNDILDPDIDVEALNLPDISSKSTVKRNAVQRKSARTSLHSDFIISEIKKDSDFNNTNLFSNLDDCLSYRNFPFHDKTNDISSSEVTISSKRHKSSVMQEGCDISDIFNYEQVKSDENEVDMSSSSDTDKDSKKIPGPVGLLPPLETISDIERVGNELNARISQRFFRPFALKENSDCLNFRSYAVAIEELKKVLSNNMILTLKFVKRKYRVHKGSRKIPFICLAVKDLTSYPSNASATFTDGSDTIMSTVCSSILRNKELDVKTGVSLILRNVTIFSTCNRRNVYLNITPLNVAAIYYADSSCKRTAMYPSDWKCLQMELSNYLTTLSSRESLNECGKGFKDLMNGISDEIFDDF